VLGLSAARRIGLGEPVALDVGDRGAGGGEAIFRRRRVRLRYRAFGGRRSLRELSPFGLVVHEARWYLVAHDHGRRALRTFRADRIGDPELLRRGGGAARGLRPRRPGRALAGRGAVALGGRGAARALP
jgi:hypothetical protein